MTILETAANFGVLARLSLVETGVDGANTVNDGDVGSTGGYSNININNGNYYNSTIPEKINSL